MKLGDIIKLREGRKGKVIDITPSRIVAVLKGGEKVSIRRKEEGGSGIYSVDMDKIRAKIQEIQRGIFWTPAVGKNVIRILPPWSKEGLYFFTTTLHYGFKTEGRGRAYPCITALGESKCPVCELLEELSSSGDTSDKQIASRIRPKIKHYSNIIDRKGGTDILIYGYSSKNLRALQGYMEDPDWGDITHPKHGHDVVIERVGTGFTDTKYEVRLKPTPSPIGVEDWVKKLHKLDQVVVEPIDYASLKSIVKENFGRIKKSGRPIEDEEENEWAEEIDEE